MNLSDSEKRYVEYQCSLCRYWAGDAGCAYTDPESGLNDPYPIAMCPQFRHVLTGFERTTRRFLTEVVSLGRGER